MKRILLLLIAFAGVFANAFALDKVPDWQNDWTSAPTNGQQFYLYNTAADGFIKGGMGKNSSFVSAQDAGLWTKGTSLSTVLGDVTYYLWMDSNEAWTSETSETDWARQKYARDFSYTINSGKFAIYFSTPILGTYYLYKNSDNKFASVRKSAKYEWYLINEKQWKNHMAYIDYYAAAYEAKNNHEDATKESKAWRNQFLTLDFKFEDLSGKDESEKLKAITADIKKWNEHPENYALLEETGESNSSLISNNIFVAIKRTLTGGCWNTFCVPFNITATELTATLGANNGVEIKQFVGADDNNGSYTLKFNNAGGNLNAGQCYLVWLTNTKENIVIGTCTTKAANTTPTEQDEDGVKFKGTYDQTSVACDAGNYIINTNKFYYVNKADVTIKAFRGYFNIPGATDALAASFDDEDVTGITSVTNGNDNGNDNLYNIAGQRVNENAKGIIIKNGKKYFVK